MRVFKIVLASLLLCVPIATSSAAIIVFNASITSEAADAGNGTGTDGKGAATMTLDTLTNEFVWFVAWQNLSAPVTVAHFHGPATPDQNAGVEVGIDAASNPSIGSTFLDDQQTADLLNGLWYINIHTSAFPGGEIRGQVLPVTPIPVPAAVWLMGSALVGVIGLRRRQKIN